MGAAPKIIDKKILQGLVPFNALSPVHFNEVAQKTAVEELRAGRVLFNEGDRDNQSVYLIEGEVTLLDGKKVVGSVVGGSDAARHPLAQQQPRQVGARAKTNIVIARVDSSLLDIMLTWDQSSGYEVAEIDDNEDDDWMTRILQSQAFLKLPPSNIQRLLMSVESISVSAGNTVIKQGGEGDYFYIIKNGRCMVTRKPSANAKEVKLAELGNGDAFGEDALVSDAKRNATVTMMTDGVLMRLAKKDFIELLKEPLLNKVNYAEAEKLVEKGAKLLDVRLPGEFENIHIVDSHNIPLSALRLEASTLESDTKYIVCCDTGRRSASAAFVLSQRGFEVFVLDEGFGSVPPEALVGDSASGASVPPVEETSADVVELKPQREAKADAEPVMAAAVETAAAGALEQELAGLLAELAAANTAREQAEARQSDLQEELERVRDEIREQMQEFEQSLSGLRKENTEYLAELQRLKTDSDLQQQSDAVAREQAEALEKEFEQFRAEEHKLRSEVKTLQTEKSKLESELERGVQLRVSADAEITELKARIGELEPLADQLKASANRVTDLESKLQDAVQSGAQVESEVSDQLKDLRAQLETAVGARADLEQRLSVAEEAAANERQAAADQQRAAGALQERLAALEGELRAAQDASLAQQTRLAELEAAHKAAQGNEDGLQRALDEKVAELQVAAQQRDEVKRALDDATAQIQALSADSSEQVNELQAALEAAHKDTESLATERDRLREQNEQRAAELESIRARVDELEQSEQSLAEAQRALDEGRAGLQSELDEAQTKLLDASEELTRLQQALDDANAIADREGQEKQGALLALEQERDALQAQLAAVQSQLAEGDSARQTVEAQLNDQLATLEARTATVQQERDALATELDAAKARLDQMVQDQASGTDAQQASLEQMRQELVTAQAQVSDADAARQEIEARLSEMSAAAGEAQSQLEQLQKDHAAALAQAHQKTQEEFEEQLRELKSDLEGARAALAREQSQRSNLEEATKAEIKARIKEVNAQATLELDRVQSALNDAREQLEEINGQLAAAESARKATEAEIVDVRKAAEAEKKALAAELEQLGMATTADLQAMQKQVQVLQEELNATRKLNAGKPADEELERLRLLLDEAREEAATTRKDVEQWREQATSARSDADQWREEAAAARGDAEQWREQALGNALEEEQQTDELAAMNIQMADIQSRVDDALRLRDEAQKEIEQLRVQVAAAKMAKQPATPAFAVDNEPSPARRSGLWLGMVAGALVGVLGAGGALWWNQQGNPPSNQNAASSAEVIKPSVTEAVAPPVVAKTTEPSTAPTKPEPVVEKAPEPEPEPKVVSVKHREFSDDLGEGFRGPTMIELPATRYSMGSSVSSLDADERPRHEVQLGRFAIAKHKVTFDQFDAFARATGRALVDDKGWGRGNRPVTGVSWEEAVAYARWLSELTGKRYRLPSEAEWEYAAGGAGRTLYWWGNSLGEGRANCFNCGSEWDARTTAPVGSFPANTLGLHDTAGNVAEWVQDCYHPNYEGAPTDGSAWLSTGCPRRVVRGGGFNSPADSLRTTKRDQQLANTPGDDIGFRVVRDM